MKRTWVVLSASFWGCVATGGAAHVERGDRAVASGRLETASSEYDLALKERPDDPWTQAVVERGRARIEIERMKRTAISDVATLDDVIALRVRLRELGGDTGYDATLVAAENVRAATLVSTAESSAAATEIDTAAGLAMRLLRIDGIDDAIRQRAQAIVDNAARLHAERAAALGDAHPLAAVAHAALAARFRGEAHPAADTLTAPYRRSVAVTIRGVSCPGVDAAAQSILSTSSGGPRHVDVDIEIKSCSGTSNTSSVNDPHEWKEDVTEYVTQDNPNYECHNVEEKVPDPVPACYDKPNSATTYLHVCETTYSTVTREQCSGGSPTIQVPVTHTEDRSGTRTIVTDSWSMTVAGHWSVRRRDGKSWTGNFGGTRSEQHRYAPSLGTFAAIDEGQATSLDELTAKARDELVGGVQQDLTRAFDIDIAAAVAEAGNAARTNRTDDEEEAWTRAVVLGGSDSGTWRRHFGTDAKTLHDAFAGVSANALEPQRLGDVHVFAVPPAPGRFTDDELERIAASSVPTLGKKIWFQAETSFVSMPHVMGTTGGDLGGDGGIVFAVRGGTRVLSASQSSPWGLRLRDDAAIGAGVGAGMPGNTEVPSGVGTAQLFASYTIGVSYRIEGGNGLFAGVRPIARLTKLPSATATDASVPLFARFEKAGAHGAFAIEATALSMVGAAEWSGAAHLAFGKSSDEGWKSRTRFLTFRVERVTHDFELLLPIGEGMRAPAQSVAVTSYAAAFGLGF